MTGGEVDMTGGGFFGRKVSTNNQIKVVRPEEKRRAYRNLDVIMA
jgi:hypothetical protein